MRTLRGDALHRVRVGQRHGANLSLNYRTLFRNGHLARRQAEVFESWRVLWRERLLQERRP